MRADPDRYDAGSFLSVDSSRSSSRCPNVPRFDFFDRAIHFLLLPSIGSPLALLFLFVSLSCDRICDRGLILCSAMHTVRVREMFKEI